jgi:hypothetical protein
MRTWQWNRGADSRSRGPEIVLQRLWSDTSGIKELMECGKDLEIHWTRRANAPCNMTMICEQVHSRYCNNRYSWFNPLKISYHIITIV